LEFIEIKMKKKAIIISIKSYKLTNKEKLLLSKKRPWGLIYLKEIFNLQPNKILIKIIRKLTKDKNFPILIDEEGLNGF